MRGFDTWRGDVVAGVTLAAYAIPVSLAYATLAGLPPQVGVYGYLMGGLGYALAGSSRYLAVGPTSAISLVIAGTAGVMADAGTQRYAEIAAAAAMGVALFCLLAWLFRLSVLVKLISDSVLTGFKAGAGLTIALTQLPGFLGIPGGGHSLLERVVVLVGQAGDANPLTFAVGAVALGALWIGDRLLPGRPLALGIVAGSIVVSAAFGLAQYGVAVAGEIPSGLPQLAVPHISWRDQEGVVSLAMGCMLLAYIEGVAAARAFATKHKETIDPRRELLGLAAANAATAAVGGYPVAGGLSQTAVNEGAGAQSRRSLVVASAALALCLMFFTALIADLPRAVLAAVVLRAVAGLIDLRAIQRMWNSSRVDFVNALAAFVGVLVLGVLQGILVAALISVLVLLAVASTPHVAVLGRIPGTTHYSDSTRHPDNEAVPGVLAVRPEASLLYLNAEHVEAEIMRLLEEAGAVEDVVCDLSASPTIDLAGVRMLADLANKLWDRGITLRLVSVRGRVRDVLCAEGLDTAMGGVARGTTLEVELADRH